MGMKFERVAGSAAGSWLAAAAIAGCSGLAWAGPQGYYRQPTIAGDTIVFVAEGDLWKVTTKGGVATRLTSHPGDEASPRLSPDGSRVAFTGTYEGPNEAYLMPIDGGLPSRLTFDGSRITVVGWKDDDVLISTQRHSGLPSWQLLTVDPQTMQAERVPLAQASDGCFSPDGRSLVFTRLPFQGSHTKRYKGGTVQQLWKYDLAATEAVPMTSDFAGTSTAPMWWNGRVAFLSDRSGIMNVWSMAADGSDVRQHTNHTELDAKGASLSGDLVVYQLGADLWLHDLVAGTDTQLKISLDTDLDQMREKWVKKPWDFLTAAHVSPDGSRVALTARGEVFVVPREPGRLVHASRADGVRYRNARFSADGQRLLVLSDESGEVEFWNLPRNGVGEGRQLSEGGTVLRWEGIESPDGKWLAHHDKNQTLWVSPIGAEGKLGPARKVAEDPYDNLQTPRWSADSAWLAFTCSAENFVRQVRVHNVASGETLDATTTWFDSYSPTFSPDGAWLYFLSDRTIRSVVGSPWGPMAPEPFFDNKTRLYAIALKPGTRSPFDADDELTAPKPEAMKAPPATVPATPAVTPPGTPEPNPAEPNMPKPDPTQPATPPAEQQVPPAKVPDPQVPPVTTPPPTSPPVPTLSAPVTDGKAVSNAKKPPTVDVVAAGLATRLIEVPGVNGNYADLSVNDKRLFYLSSPSGEGQKTDLMVLEIVKKEPEAKALVKDVVSYELSGDGKWILVRKSDALYVIDAGAAAPASLDKAKIDLSGWTFSMKPREEWVQMFREAWRLERDYFYDRGMHGVDWIAMRTRYEPLVERVSTRAELSDVISQMVGELSALHIFVTGGDMRKGDDQIKVAALGAVFARDEAANGFKVVRRFESDPDYPARASPLAKPGVEIVAGDVVLEVNGRSALSVTDLSELIRNQAGKQVLLLVKPASGAAPRSVIVQPITAEDEADLRYHEWEFTRRQEVESASDGDIGYVHLRAMGNDNMSEFARGFYPAFNRKGLIIDVRHNRGGNIDSWLLSRLMRKAWFYWQGRSGMPYWNMQFAFRGHIAVLCDERTASDGEAFAEGIKRLGLGRVIGTRTWGGEIWLSSSNFLVDGGIATAAEYGVYGPEGAWLIEGHGVEPDDVVDNLPRATFDGKDAQLEAALAYLKAKIIAEPVEVPAVPKHPDKSFRRPE